MKKTKSGKVESKYMKNKRLKEEAAAKAAGEGAKTAMVKGGKGVKTAKGGTTGREETRACSSAVASRWFLAVAGKCREWVTQQHIHGK